MKSPTATLMLSGLWLAMAGSSAALAAGPDESRAPALDLLRDPSLVVANGKALGPAWQTWQPEWEPAQMELRPTPSGLRCYGWQPYAVGGVVQTVSNLAGARCYAVSAKCEFLRVADPYAAALVRVEWLKDGKALHPAGMLARGPRIEGNLGAFEDLLEAPPEANAARITLAAKWLQGGALVWQQASLRPADPPPPRKVKIGAVYLRPRNSTPERNLEQWIEQVNSAGKLGLDILCLSEAILMVGTPATASAVAEAIPGPTTDRLGEAARRNKLWLVAGLMEKDEQLLYNTAVLVDREGRLAGKYRKVHLPREEWRKGIAPGADYPVFQTEFGTVAIQICYDYFFPETAQILALRGAEIVFAPTWGTTLPDKEERVEGRNIFRVRARDNGIYLVPSVYDGDSMVIDPLGRVLASSNGQTGVFWAEVDLNQREPLWWVGHWRSIGPRHRMPDSYAPLLKR